MGYVICGLVWHATHQLQLVWEHVTNPPTTTTTGLHSWHVHFCCPVLCNHVLILLRCSCLHALHALKSNNAEKNISATGVEWGQEAVAEKYPISSPKYGPPSSQIT